MTQMSVDTIEKVMSFICNAAYQASASLAGEKGASLFMTWCICSCPFIQEALSSETKQLISENGIRNINYVNCTNGSISNIILSIKWR